jgi:hypothetical protein
VGRGLSAREISRRTGLARNTVSRLVAADAPPRYSRAPGGSILDPFKDWICEQLQADSKIPSQRLRELAVELGCGGGKTVVDAVCSSEPFLSFCGQLQVGWIILDAGDAQAKGQLERQHRFLRSNFEPRRSFANHLDFQEQLGIGAGASLPGVEGTRGRQSTPRPRRQGPGGVVEL